MSSKKPSKWKASSCVVKWFAAAFLLVQSATAQGPSSAPPSETKGGPSLNALAGEVAAAISQIERRIASEAVATSKKPDVVKGLQDFKEYLIKEVELLRSGPEILRINSALKVAEERLYKIENEITKAASPEAKNDLEATKSRVEQLKKSITDVQGRAFRDVTALAELNSKIEDWVRLYGQIRDIDGEEEAVKKLRDKAANIVEDLKNKCGWDIKKVDNPGQAPPPELRAEPVGREAPATVSPSAQPPASEAAGRRVAGETAAAPVRPSAGKPFTNSLGMTFVPVRRVGVMFSIYETRVQDYAPFVRATGARPPDFWDTPNYPIGNVTYDECVAFCRWLTKMERERGVIGPGDEYRLPTDREWSAAVGLDEERGEWPEDRGERVKGQYPWGTAWPPPQNCGNYRNDLRLDPFPGPAPVGSFSPNRFGLYDMGGNVWERTLDHFNEDGWWNLRGGSWETDRQNVFLSSHRRHRKRENPCERDTGFRVVLDVP